MEFILFAYPVDVKQWYEFSYIFKDIKKVPLLCAKYNTH